MADQPFEMLSDAEFRRLSPAEKDAYVLQLREYVDSTYPETDRARAKRKRQRKTDPTR